MTIDGLITEIALRSSDDKIPTTEGTNDKETFSHNIKNGEPTKTSENDSKMRLFSYVVDALEENDENTPKSRKMPFRRFFLARKSNG